MKKLLFSIIILIFLSLMISFTFLSGKESSTDILKINLNKDSPLKVSKLFDSKITYIQLDAPINELIGSISKIFINDDYVLIGDFDHTQKIYIFSGDGKFIKSISNQGSGPFEYADLVDFSVDFKNREIYLFSRFGKIIKFDFNAKPISEDRMEILALKYQPYDGGYFVSGADNEYSLIHFTNNYEKDDSYIPIIKPYLLDFASFNSFSYNNDSLLFLPFLSQDFYRIDNYGVSKRYQIDFGEYNITEDFVKMFSTSDQFMQRYESRLPGYIDHFFESVSYLHFRYIFNNKVYYAFYNKNQKKVYNSSKIENDLNGLDFWSAIGQTSNGIVQTKTSLQIKNNIKKLKKKLGDDKFEKFKKENPTLMKISDNASDMDNPILIIYEYSSNFE